MDKAKYLIAKKNGKLEKFRSDEIARRISKKYSYNDQFAILMDKDTKPMEWFDYQQFRSQVKADVDLEIQNIEQSLSTNGD